jgi:hypothetical protein
MANALEQRGFFWWLNEPNGQTNSKETSVPGSLTISEAGHVKLDLDGALWYAEPPEPQPWGESRFLPRGKWITGRLGSYGDGGHVLLDGLERTDFSIADELPSPQSYKADLCITKDSPFDTDFNLASFDHLRIELVRLEEWLNLDSIQIGTEQVNDVDVEVAVKYKNHNFSYKTSDGTISIESLTLGAGILASLYQHPQRNLTFKQTHWLIYTPTSQSSIESLQNVFTRIEELLALLIGSYCQLDWPIVVQRNDDLDSWHRFYFLRDSVPAFEPNHWFMWTSFDVLRESFGDLFFAWKALREQSGAGYYLYLAELRNPLPYTEHRFVNLIWALESLHRVKRSDTATSPSERIQRILNRFNDKADKADLKWLEGKLKYADEPSLEVRIFETFSALPLNLDKAGLRKFSSRCAQRRNQISHQGGPPGNEP